MSQVSLTLCRALFLCASSVLFRVWVHIIGSAVTPTHRNFCTTPSSEVVGAPCCSHNDQVMCFFYIFSDVAGDGMTIELSKLEPPETRGYILTTGQTLGSLGGTSAVHALLSKCIFRNVVLLLSRMVRFAATTVTNVHLGRECVASTGSVYMFTDLLTTLLMCIAILLLYRTIHTQLIPTDRLHFFILFQYISMPKFSLFRRPS